MINNDVLLFSAANEKTPHEQLLHYWASRMQGFFPYKMPTLDRGITWTLLKVPKVNNINFLPKISLYYQEKR